MERLKKKVFISAARGLPGGQALAVVDTGTRLCVVPLKLAKRVGLDLEFPKREGSIKGFGKGGLHGRIVPAFVALVAGGCAADVDVFVPDAPGWPHFLVGSLFLQKVRASIIYEGKHPVFCRRPRKNPPRGEFEDMSFGEYP